ncbi:MAG: hypothetical protein ABIF82_12525, partial [Planctomycetota bacterium]
MLACAILLCGCRTTPVMTTLPSVPTSEQVATATTGVTAARQEIQAAGVEIKVTAKAADPLKAAPALA